MTKLTSEKKIIHALCPAAITAGPCDVGYHLTGIAHLVRMVGKKLRYKVLLLVVSLPSRPMKKCDSLDRASCPGMPERPDRAGWSFR
jgi:hypothetical protein